MTLSLGACTKQVTDEDIRNIGLADVRQISAGERSGVVLIDPRTPERFAEGHIPGAVNIQLMAIDPKGRKIPLLDNSSEIVVYGGDPGSPVARAMTKKLITAGYKRVRFYAGGLDEWTQTGELASDLEPEGE